MKRLIESISNNISRLGENMFHDNHRKNLKIRLSLLDRILLKEYQNLIEALEKEDDPTRQDMLADEIIELEAILEKRQILMQDLKF